MPSPVCDEATFIGLFEQLGAAGTAKQLGIGVRSVYSRRRCIESSIGRPLHPPISHKFSGNHPERLTLQIENGIVQVGSDAHYWPGEPSTAHRAFVWFAKKFKPQLIVQNGDVFDGAGAGRHAPIMWENKPTIKEELDVVEERLREIVKASPKSEHVWTLGNHDARFETKLAAQVPEFAGIDGMHLKDHFPDWVPCWSVWVNDELVIKHRFKGGVHATHNNTVMSGKTMCTGHLHSQKITPHTDYNGDRYGVDCGTLADIHGPQFMYLEDNPRSWRSGFAVFTFSDGEMLPPEVVTVRGEGRVAFRGELIEV